MGDLAILQDHLQVFGAVCIEGPKWCGKTRTAENCCRSKFMVGDPKKNFQNRTLASLDPAPQGLPLTLCHARQSPAAEPLSLPVATLLKHVPDIDCPCCRGQSLPARPHREAVLFLPCFVSLPSNPHISLLCAP